MIDFPWKDRRGRFSGLRAAACLLAVAPALWIAFLATTGALGPRPYEAATHETGLWTLRLLLITLALTPLRRIIRLTRLAGIRRLLGLTVFLYAMAHLTLYIGDQAWNLRLAASEIVTRVYLVVGLATVLGLTLLAATSNDASIRWLGINWHRLHRIVYLLAALGVLHFFLQAKLEATEAALMMGLFLLLMGYRLANRLTIPLNSAVTLAGVASLAALMTAGMEALWYGVTTGIPWQAVLQANLTVTPLPRPAGWVLATGLFVALLPLLEKALSRITIFRISPVGTRFSTSPLRARQPDPPAS